MSCYAPLSVNVNPASSERGRAWQWDSDLIGYNAIKSYGSPSYYAQSMFNTYIGDHVVPISNRNLTFYPLNYGCILLVQYIFLFEEPSVRLQHWKKYYSVRRRAA